MLPASSFQSGSSAAVLFCVQSVQVLHTSRAPCCFLVNHVTPPSAVSQVGVASESKGAAHRTLSRGCLRSQSTYCLSAASHCLHRFSRKLAVINQQKKKMFSSVLTVCVCLLTCLLPCVSGEEMKVKPGEDVTLQCRGPRDAEIKLITWNRTDLKSEDYVFFYREKRLYEKNQLPSYRGRVELTDPEMKDGNVSVILKNVTINDAARYACHVGKKGSRPQLINTITLKVVDSGITEERRDKERGDKEGGDKDLHVGLGVGLLVGVVGVVGGFMIYRKRRRHRAAFI